MRNIFEQNSLITADDRAYFTGRRGAVLWFTGLSGSGKSTIAALAEKTLVENGEFVCLLDGDNLRLGLNSDLGFSEEDRDENIRRVAHVAALFAQSGGLVLACTISPLSSHRDFARKLCLEKKLAFVEIHVKASLKTCIARDVKGLYKKALEGEIKDFTGIDAPYEEPINPDLILNTDLLTSSQAADRVVEYIYTLATLEGVLENTIDAALEAGKKILEVYNNDFSVNYKEDKSPLTLADTAANEIICSILSKNYPDYAILTEESNDDLSRLDNPFCFIVDPLDGTKEFIKKKGEFTVNIALSYCGKSILGVVYAPALGKLYYAAEGIGAFFAQLTDGGEENTAQRMVVSNRRDKLIVMASRSHSDEKLEALLERNKAKIAQTVASGSSLKGCLIAQGEADVYYRTGLTCEWDTAAMQCIVEQAGGIFLQADGSPMRYNRENPLNEKGFFILNDIANRFE
ncbi:MAG TPA: 3'(2'),5'-bisphosphate nucleotidase CysQ [Clostridiales bacterium]|nr:3'(2'),5'-bisphosphate nucleotidase CysQ [Clostridiales bacterium]